MFVCTQRHLEHLCLNLASWRQNAWSVFACRPMSFDSTSDEWHGPRRRRYDYLRRQGGYVIVVVCLFVCLLATLLKNLRTNLHEIFSEGWQWADEQMIKFWWWSGLRTWIRIRIATMERRALAEVCIFPVLLVQHRIASVRCDCALPRRVTGHFGTKTLQHYCLSVQKTLRHSCPLSGQFVREASDKGSYTQPVLLQYSWEFLSAPYGIG